MRKGIVWLFFAALLALPVAAQTVYAPVTRGPYYLQTAVTAGNGTSLVVNCQAQTVTLYVAWSAGTSAGAVQVETASDPTYAGTWAPLGSPIAWSAASSSDVVQVSQPVAAIRARVSTTVVGGTVTVTAWGR